MSFSVEDKVIDYVAIAAKLGLGVIEKPNVETHDVTIKLVGEYPTVLVNLIRYFATYAYPTRRMTPVEVETVNPDRKMMLEPVFIQLSDMKLAHDCPLGDGKFSIAHNKLFSNPLMVSAKFLDIAKYTNDHQITVLDKGCTFAFNYTITEQTGVESGLSYHYFASGFDRTNMGQVDVTNKNGDIIKYNKGSFSFRYTDNMSGKEVFEKIKTLAKNTLKDIIDNMDKYFLLNINTPYLVVPNDRSGIVAMCIALYVFDRKPVNYCVSENSDQNQTTIKYPNSTAAEIKPEILAAIKNIISDLA